MRMAYLKASGAAVAMLLLLSACSKGGQLTLEPGAVKVKSKGSPYVSVVQGAKANLVGADNSANGWVTIQSVSSRTVTSGSHNMIVNKPSAY